ncbi:hypothetical protein BN7_453 [Wickerhamomyces ciferrii]|uniref:phosphoinositide 5-phosphatase n=1 Tax=Wickerhamomyces ciferrii (strain ATCC 14091 / BCRC 22168 / CBS 111 / JCM 3599 / NBRC 0793 / NRRL Y-1031 F-60-10) TaxID=1206466 RepID=K0KHR3_WICCF|nr:uncharacterized protein BN7_453 [Wickerhamomyces ciferrii]CCH40919.1 hypothetical protein BN7_453 [Wickerhamomyces ciferrii]
MKIFFNARPRSFILVSNDYALTLQYISTTRQCLIQYTPVSTTDFTNYQESTNLHYYGLAGVLEIKGYVFFCVITDQTQIGSPRPSEVIYKVKDVEFYCLNSLEFDNLTLNRYSSESNRERYENEHPCSKIRKLLTLGFYYSRDFDLTNNLQERSLNHDVNQMFTNYDKRFLWNIFMIQELLNFRSRILSSERYYLDRSEFLTFLVRGFAKTFNTEVGGESSLITVISRISSAKTSGPFGLTGCDEDGFVSNYIESEILLYNKTYFFAYTQVRGNVPIFFELENALLSNKRINFPKSDEMNEVAFDKHMDSVLMKHNNIYVINGLKSKTNEEALSSRYRALLRKKGFPTFNIDLSRDQLKNSPHKLSYQLKDAILEIGALCYDVKKKVYVGKQLGIFRINTLNSIEKPGLMEKIISLDVLNLSLKEMGIPSSNDLLTKHNLVWDENNAALMTIYEKSSRRHGKKAFEGISNNPVTLHDPIHDYISTELTRRRKEYSSSTKISIFSGSFNVNAEMSEQDITQWIFPNDDTNCDIVVIGIEEIVELTTSKMLVTDIIKRTFWENKIKKTLNTRDKYSLVWSSQLGGIVLILFVKDDKLGNIKEIDGSFKKTGFGGMSANKGGIAVSFLYSSTRFCFLVAHLAAGLENVEQRHSDYKAIAKNIRFARNRSIKDHDAIIWVGDFNYRILLTNEQVKQAIELEDYNFLFEHDQLSNQMIAGESFPYFNEMEIKFPPTYKFDKGTKTYDTSEKLRIPAWTDRVLSRGAILQQLSYGSAPDVTFSDHRPVFGIFEAKVTIIDEILQQNLTKTLYEKRKLEIGKQGGISQILNNAATQAQLFPSNTINSNNNQNNNNQVNNQNNNDFNNSTSHGLPPPSSDKSKWWIEGGQSVKVDLDINDDEVVINPNRPSNPFEPTNEPDFILR